MSGSAVQLWVGITRHRNSTYARYGLIVWLVLCAFSATDATAQYADKLRLSAGAYDIFRYDSRTSLTENNSGLGVAFSPQDTLGWKGEQTVFRFDAHYRLTPAHSLAFSWYDIDQSGMRGLREEIDWIDVDGNPIVIPIGADVRSNLGYSIYKLEYLWSFYHNDKVELSVSAGLHVTRVRIELSTETTSSGLSASDADSTLPLPVVGVSVGYNVTPRFSWLFQAEVFSLKLNDLEGLYSDVQLGAEYRLTRHFAFGAALGSNAMDVKEVTDETRFEYDNRLTGLHLFVSAYF